MNPYDILILLAVAGAVVFGVLRVRKQKASGKGCCGTCGSCEGCSLCKPDRNVRNKPNP